MRTYKVNKIEHTVFDSLDELPDNINYLNDWREGCVGDWVKADDDCVIQILRKGTMLRAKGKKREVSYIGTCTGTFTVAPKTKMDTSRRVNIYSFGGSLSSEDIMESRKDLNSKEKLFVLNLLKGMDPKEAYMSVYPTNNPGYANVKAAQLIKTERVDTYMKEEHKEVCKELGIDAKGVLHGIKLIAQTAEKDDTKLKALFKLSDILDLEDKTTTSVQQMSGAVFQGFSKDELEKVERKELSDGNK
jgi:phage terminase small subunit